MNGLKEQEENDVCIGDKIMKKYTEDIKYFMRINYKEAFEIDKDFVLNKLIKSGVKI